MATLVWDRHPWLAKTGLVDLDKGSTSSRCGEMLFIDARNEGEMVDRTHRELSDEDITRIAGTYHA